MGNSDSQEQGDAHQFDGVETLGYRVLGVQPNSPASKAGLVSFFDFLVGANGLILFGNNQSEEEDDHDQSPSGKEKKKEEEDDEFFEDVDFPALLKENTGKDIELLVWNIKSQSQRLVTLRPSNTWGGTGLLGVTIRMDNYMEAEERLLRVLSVQNRSPASIAGLTPGFDYLLGTTLESFDNDEVLARVLDQHEDRVVEVYVYNTESDVVRVVTLMPTLSWGGPGLLGAEVGRGYLHRLPRACRGTLGISFDRRVRVGSAVKSLPLDGAAAAAAAAAGESASRDNGAGEGAGAGIGSKASAGGQEEGDIVSELTCTATGRAVQMEPQLEMEPNPNSPLRNRNRPVSVAVDELPPPPSPPLLSSCALEPRRDDSNDNHDDNDTNSSKVGPSETHQTNNTEEEIDTAAAPTTTQHATATDAQTTTKEDTTTITRDEGIPLIPADEADAATRAIPVNSTTPSTFRTPYNSLSFPLPPDSSGDYDYDGSNVKSDFMAAAQSLSLGMQNVSSSMDLPPPPTMSFVTDDGNGNVNDGEVVDG